MALHIIARIAGAITAPLHSMCPMVRAIAYGQVVEVGLVKTGGDTFNALAAELTYTGLARPLRKAA